MGRFNMSSLLGNSWEGIRSFQLVIMFLVHSLHQILYFRHIAMHMCKYQPRLCRMASHFVARISFNHAQILPLCAW